MRVIRSRKKTGAVSGRRGSRRAHCGGSGPRTDGVVVQVQQPEDRRRACQPHGLPLTALAGGTRIAGTAAFPRPRARA